MKCSILVVLCLPLLGSAVVTVGRVDKDRPITKVVRLLEEMLEQSKADGDQERYLYGKYKCYCDTNEATKKKEIKELTTQISLLENEIARLQAENAVLSKEVAQLKADMEANKAAQEKATGLRDKENKAWLALEEDLDAAIKQAQDAIKVLAEIGNDQTLGQAAADNEKFMADYENKYGSNSTNLLRLKATVKQALLLASPAKVHSKTVVEAFLQAPFTGSYTSQSAEVVGILKDMEDTLKFNLESARTTEETAQKAYDAYMVTMGEEYDAMKKSKEGKQGELVANDGSLSDANDKLQSAQTQKADAEEFLEKLLNMCAAKAKEYDERTMLRANEEAAIAEAISILNSDAAFATFGKVDATSVSFLQTASSKRSHKASPVDMDTIRRKAENSLRGKAGLERSGHVSKILALLAAHNPFTVVLKEIQKMIDLISKEGEADEEKLTWCREERRINNENLEQKKSQIATLNGQISALVEKIEHPVTGLLQMISETEESLRLNTESQTTETAQRTQENLAYQEDISHLVDAENLVGQAIKVLDAYYAKILSSSLVQTARREDPAPPETWDAKYAGRSTQGTSAIDMLKFILTSTQKEQQEAHEAEQQAQHAYEDSMQSLKDTEAELLKTLAKLKLDLAEAQKDLQERREDLKKTIAEKEAIEAYLLEIKPGCDFMETNMELRTGNRQAETEALETARDYLKGSPAYLTAVAEAHNESLDECLEICKSGGEDHVDCKACLAHVSVPGYCAGHPGTTGC